MMQLNDFIDLEKISDIRDAIRTDDRPLVVKDVLKDLDSWITWDKVGECMTQSCLADVLYLSKASSIYEHVAPCRIELEDDIPALAKSNGGNHINTTPSPDGNSFLSKQFTMIISDYERMNTLVTDLINHMVQIFHINMDGHGVWPAEIDWYSGHAHVYCGLEGSRSYHPKCDGPNNFIFQMSGTQKIILYENRASALSNVELNIFDTVEERKELYDSLRVLDELTLEPGDCVYIPNRQFYYIEPIENTISMRIPLVLHGPLTVSF